MVYNIDVYASMCRNSLTYNRDFDPEIIVVILTNPNILSVLTIVWYKVTLPSVSVGSHSEVKCVAPNIVIG